ncbi:Zn-dependent hydrolase, glyoxylase [Chthonomonas calidirosea]|uniref:Zn-dependent hydrolases, including glyoxylases n=1 Tax=Chthonomonas calidirosea (strain DSM 23976 / ICMP 18418 / T49) TaxID=1303518 RepID=S0EU27_CHTCT|nr:MBL fold metallo-hydrolase [Chthonomonas calidirosea]CCW35093.1 Zn-dependent hydrolases, including glyoxylases [Chthonomonas calidirosea T49]CEK20327.1 Zn-dependent hydrolase, glyoxylase [Chthonomonas calidirosea]CEK20328.1 Zn-dependent hydrolase, glyoxylase [Chthonomonas calidirosea]CEK20890.1 Zn-dependent hydrolase, glyoxylase [Chthonomonas calidirosea]
MPIYRHLLGPMDNNTYLIVDEVTGEAALVDPSFDSEQLLPEIEQLGYSLRYILNTHAHLDHVVGNAFFAAWTGAPIALHKDDLGLLHAVPEQAKAFQVEVEPSPEPEILLEDGQELPLGELSIKVLHTPGHAPGHVTFLVEDAALVGDCLFQGSIGRVDLPGGSAEQLMASLHNRLLTLPDETRVLPGHGEPTTIGAEKRHNPFLRSSGHVEHER